MLLHSKLASSIRSLIASTTYSSFRAHIAIAVRTQRVWRADGRGIRDQNFKNLRGDAGRAIDWTVDAVRISRAATTAIYLRVCTGEVEARGTAGNEENPGLAIFAGSRTRHLARSALVQRQLARHTFLRTSASCRRASNMICVREKFEFVTRRFRPV